MPPTPLSGTCRVPGDKSLSHRALLLGALTDGATQGPVRVTGLGSGGDNRSTARILRRVGVRVERETPEGDGDAPGDAVLVYGVGLDGLRAPSPAGEPLDCGNSGTTMRLLLGVLAGQPFEATLVGDASLSRRPMGRVLDPLAAMGMEILSAASSRGLQHAPLTVRGHRPLRGLDYRSPVASAQVKSALLLAGLWAETPTTVREPGPSRDHTERMLTYLGCPVETGPDGDASRGRWARLQPPPADRRALDVRPLDVPGDLSSAAFLLAAAALVPGSRVTVEGVGTNPTRTGVLDALEAMGVEVQRARERVVAGEPRADLTVSHAALGPFEIAGALSVRAIDELPLLATIAARADGVSRIRDAAELRVKESDRVAKTAALLRSFGVPVDEHPDGLTIYGDPARPLRPGDVDADGDHRVAMCASILGLLAPPGTRIAGAGAIATSFPTFFETLEGLGAGPALRGLDVSA